MRVVIIGNAGSGKSWLAEQISERKNVPVISLDRLFWEPGGYTVQRPKAQVLDDVERMTAGNNWILEGVFGELVEPVLNRASRLLWLDMDWQICKASLIARENERRNSGAEAGDEESFRALLDYAGNYWERENMRSWKGHERLFREFAGEKRVFGTRSDVERYMVSI